MVTLTQERLAQIVREAVKAEQSATAPQAQEPTTPLNPPSAGAGHSLASRQIDEMLAEDKAVKALQSLLDGGKLRLPQAAQQRQESDGPDQADSAAGADMEQNPVANAVKSLDNIAGQGIPWGSAIAGGFVGLVTSEVIDGFSPPTPGEINFTNFALKLGAAWASIQFLPDVTGRTAGLISSGVLIFSAARMVLPIDEWIQNLVDWFSGLGGGQQANRFRNRGDFDQSYELNPGSGSSYGYYGGHAESHQLLPGFGGPGQDALAGVYQ